jgi:hypothetical protein
MVITAAKRSLRLQFVKLRRLAMLHREHLRLSLESELEANALITNNGARAYLVARQRAEEASSDEMANDWNGVAAAISRRTWKARRLLAHGLH